MTEAGSFPTRATYASLRTRQTGLGEISAYALPKTEAQPVADPIAREASAYRSVEFRANQINRNPTPSAYGSVSLYVCDPLQHSRRGRPGVGAGRRAFVS
jgi:hypothetical protein